MGLTNNDCHRVGTIRAIINPANNQLLRTSVGEHMSVLSFRCETHKTPSVRHPVGFRPSFFSQFNMRNFPEIKYWRSLDSADSLFRERDHSYWLFSVLKKL